MRALSHLRPASTIRARSQDIFTAQVIPGPVALCASRENQPRIRPHVGPADKAVLANPGGILESWGQKQDRPKQKPHTQTRRDGAPTPWLLMTSEPRCLSHLECAVIKTRRHCSFRMLSYEKRWEEVGPPISNFPTSRFSFCGGSGRGARSSGSRRGRGTFAGCRGAC